MSEELHWKVVQQFVSEDIQRTVSENYQTIHLGGLSNNKIILEINNMFLKTKIFCFENSVFIHDISMCERVSEGSRCGKDESHSHPYHVDI